VHALKGEYWMMIFSGDTELTQVCVEQERVDTQLAERDSAAGMLGEAVDDLAFEQIGCQ